MSLISELKRRNVVRVGAAYLVGSWLVIQVAETIFPLYDLGDAPARVVVTVLAIGFVPALVFAWAFELTPEGLKREKDVDRSESITAHTGRKLDKAIMIVLSIGIGYFAFDKFVLSDVREAEIAEQARQEGRNEALIDAYVEKSIAVLAFQDMSPNNDQEYLSDGIAEELLNMLAKIPELRVISRSTAFSYKGKDIRLGQIAEELNVSHILEGSVRKAGNQVRITTQLIDARSDAHLWSETYERSLDDIFAVQDEIAEQVVAQLKVSMFGRSPTAEVTDSEAYSTYLQASYLGGLMTPESLQQAEALYREVLAVDPNYSQAWTGLAQLYFNMAGRTLSWTEGLRLAREAAVQALSIDPNSAVVHRNLGWVAVFYEGSLPAAARHFQRAVELAPRDWGYLSDAAAMYQFLTRFDKAIEIREFLVQMDPTRGSFHYNLGAALLYSGQLDEAVSEFETTLMLNPGLVDTSFNLAVAHLLSNNFDAALAVYADEPLDGQHLQIRSMAFSALGRHSEADAALTELLGTGNLSNVELAAVYAYRGEIDEAFGMLEKELQENGKGELYNLAGEPLLENLHSDSRWLDFLVQADRAPNQLRQISFGVTVPE